MIKAHKRLALFDIDGTILYGGPLWKESFYQAMQVHFPGFVMPETSFNGKTDLQIAFEILQTSVSIDGDLNDPALRRKLEAIIDTYLGIADELLSARKHEVTVLPGVTTLLDKLKQFTDAGIVVGLLTGNVRRGALSKLASVGLEHHFDFSGFAGVFGDDNPDRYQLPLLAQQRALQECGLHFREKDIVIIGDTIHDVNCGKSINARSIAVGTGKGVCQVELRNQNPDYYFEDLSDTDAVIRSILEPLEKTK